MPPPFRSPFRRRTFAARCAAAALTVGAPPALAESLQIVATLDRAPGNVTVTPDGRLLLSQHQFLEPEHRVVEFLEDGSTRPFPTPEWAGPRDGEVGMAAVLGLRAGRDGVVWMLDNGAGDASEARLVGWDTTDDALEAVVPVPPEASIEGSFHNDLALDATRGLAYLADIAGGIAVVDLATGEGWRRLDDHPSADAEDVDFVVRGKVLTDPEGEPVRTALNPITISADDAWVYYGAMNGTAVWRVPTTALADRTLPAEELAASVERHGDKPPSDGITIDAEGNVYVTDGGGNAIGVTRPDGTYSALVVDARIEWPDGLSTGPDGHVYATVNRLNRTAELGGGEDSAPDGSYYLVRFPALGRTVPGR